MKADDKVKFISAAKHRCVSGKQAGLKEGKHTFALIYSVGLIVAGKGGVDPFSGGDAQGADPIIQSLRKAVEDEDVKAIIFRVDSPGGAGLGCDYVRREVEKARAKKPVIVSMSDVAASGGYGVSMDATAIVAQPSTYTGSIGIFAVVPTSGPSTRSSTSTTRRSKPARTPMRSSARARCPTTKRRPSTTTCGSYKRFVELAAKGRHKTYEELEPVAQGRTWMGDEALQKGLVDRLGGIEAAIALAKRRPRPARRAREARLLHPEEDLRADAAVAGRR